MRSTTTLRWRRSWVRTARAAGGPARGPPPPGGGRGLTVAALAVHGVMTGVRDPSQRHRLNRMDLATPDGQPVRWALNLLHGVKLSDQVRGTTLSLRVLQGAAEEGLPVFFYGSRTETLDKMVEAVQRRVPGLQI